MRLYMSHFVKKRLAYNLPPDKAKSESSSVMGKIAKYFTNEA